MLNYRDLDWKLIGAVLLLSLIGILLIMSAQYYADSSYRQTFYPVPLAESWFLLLQQQPVLETFQTACHVLF